MCMCAYEHTCPWCMGVCVHVWCHVSVCTHMCSWHVPVDVSACTHVRVTWSHPCSLILPRPGVRVLTRRVMKVAGLWPALRSAGCQGPCAMSWGWGAGGQGALGPDASSSGMNGKCQTQPQGKWFPHLIMSQERSGGGQGHVTGENKAPLCAQAAVATLRSSMGRLSGRLAGLGDQSALLVPPASGASHHPKPCPWTCREWGPLAMAHFQAKKFINMVMSGVCSELLEQSEVDDFNLLGVRGQAPGSQVEEQPGIPGDPTPVEFGLRPSNCNPRSGGGPQPPCPTPLLPPRPGQTRPGGCPGTVSSPTFRDLHLGAQVLSTQQGETVDIGSWGVAGAGRACRAGAADGPGGWRGPEGRGWAGAERIQVSRGHAGSRGRGREGLRVGQVHGGQTPPGGLRPGSFEHQQKACKDGTDGGPSLEMGARSLPTSVNSIHRLRKAGGGALPYREIPANKRWK
ncbi:uncharacterized protein LOC121479393 [Vulpes lagopus]|uniref:uncharacterized protein LOC121479393 n=1 Tax=Vulpes lagopus TaxID=494514 RepID=UPI001BC9F62E|nr:uncharacterized protein LOC121479393 [Vulpes lagopus]